MLNWGMCSFRINPDKFSNRTVWIKLTIKSNNASKQFIEDDIRMIEIKLQDMYRHMIVKNFFALVLYFTTLPLKKYINKKYE